MYKSIKPIDKASIHQITSGQVIIDLQTAVKELLENSIDAGANNVEIRFKQHGLKGIEVVDNGCGIVEQDHDCIALKHHTSKLENYSDLISMSTFGFRGEALSSLCALSEQVTVITSTSSTTPMGVCLVMNSKGEVTKKSTVARQQGTTVILTNLFSSLPVRRKEFERNIKREYGKALSLLTAYALGPCAAVSGVRLTVSNQLEKGTKNVQIQTLGTPSSRSSITSLWGPKALDHIVDVDLGFEVERERSTLKRLQSQDSGPISVKIKGLVSKFAVGCGRTGTDRQFFYVNGRPCNIPTIQKAFNEVYRSFNANQAPFIVADFVLPRDAYDVNVSPDKRTILIHHEGSLITELKAALESNFSTARSTYDVGSGTPNGTQTQTLLTQRSLPPNASRATVNRGDNDTSVEESPEMPAPTEPSPDAPSSSSIVSLLQEQPSSSSVVGSFSPLKTVTRPSILAASDPNKSQVLDRPMNVDVQEESPRGQTSPDAGITLDTSQAAWSRHLGDSGRPIRGSQSEDSQETGFSEQHSKKRHKSDKDTDVQEQETVEVDQAGCLALRPSESRAEEPQSKSRTSKRSISLHNRLASFALPGSRPTVNALALARTSGDVEDDKSTEEDAEMVDELDEDDQPSSAKNDQLQDTNHVHESQSPQQSDLFGHPDSGYIQSDIAPTESNSGQAEPNDGENDIDDPESLLSQALASSTTTPSTISHKDKIVHPEVIRTDKNGGDISLRLNLSKIKQVWSQTRGPTVDSDAETSKKEGVPLDAGVSNTEDDEKAVLALSRVIDRRDFEGMTVVGQFNLGFIVVRRRENVCDDLFIVDQHAADEKYNFETLQATVKIESQKLFRSQYLELTAADEMLASENIDVLRQNGFEIHVDESASVDQGGRLKLVAIPVSKSTVFDVKDLEEIVHLMRDRPTGQMVRCSKARVMFASRACRKSVMVGMPLTQQQMTTVIRHMGITNQPWNCPHGRPTMRHLSDITTFALKPRKKIDWASF